MLQFCSGRSQNLSVAAQPGVMTQDDIDRIREVSDGFFLWEMKTPQSFCFPQ
jgi:hypothetical protein